MKYLQFKMEGVDDQGIFTGRDTGDRRRIRRGAHFRAA